jgi:hypothetical protein
MRRTELNEWERDAIANELRRTADSLSRQQPGHMTFFRREFEEIVAAGQNVGVVFTDRLEVK